MNGAVQRTHRTVTASLDERLTNVEEVLEALAARQTAAVALMRTGVNQERTHRLQLADEQRAYVDGADRQLRDALTTLRDRPWPETRWQRLRWIVTGR